MTTFITSDNRSSLLALILNSLCSARLKKNTLPETHPILLHGDNVLLLADSPSVISARRFMLTSVKLIRGWGGALAGERGSLTIFPIGLVTAVALVNVSVPLVLLEITCDIRDRGNTFVLRVRNPRTEASF